MRELFALLNFICPEVFSDYDDLDSFLHKDVQDSADKEGEEESGEKKVMTDEEKSAAVVAALHKILRPFLLRRVKSDVEKSLLPSTFSRIVVLLVVGTDVLLDL